MRTRSLLLQALARVALLLVVALVAWGALLILSALVSAASEGLKPALGRLVPSRGASAWAWLGLLSSLLALAVGLVGAALLFAGRRLGGIRPS
jgi:hypothetical protein